MRSLKHDTFFKYDALHVLSFWLIIFARAWFFWTSFCIKINQPRFFASLWNTLWISGLKSRWLGFFWRFPRRGVTLLIIARIPLESKRKNAICKFCNEKTVSDFFKKKIYVFELKNLETNVFLRINFFDFRCSPANFPNAHTRKKRELWVLHKLWNAVWLVWS